MVDKNMEYDWNNNVIRTIGVIGLGYIGLPLANGFSSHFNVKGFDVDKNKILYIKSTIPKFYSTYDDLEIVGLDAYFVTVPTPVDKNNMPDLSCINIATQTIAKCIKRGSLVIYESTVYPGTTEEICIPILEEISGLIAGKDFKVGYSPERISPGELNHDLQNTVKIISGQDDITLRIIEFLYKKVVKFKLYKAESIRIAEAAKILENTQRDVNIALMNEFAMICNKIGISTKKVIKAASTKWNFNYYEPGLVGGHCISVDPYYLIYKAKTLGFKTKLISTAREVNNEVPEYLFYELINFIGNYKININKLHITFLGCTFKENCEDIRNSKIVSLINKVQFLCPSVSIFDPIVNKKDFEAVYNLRIDNKENLQKSDVVILGVYHNEFLKDIENNPIWKRIMQRGTLVFDIKSKLNRDLFKKSYKSEIWQF